MSSDQNGSEPGPTEPEGASDFPNPIYNWMSIQGFVLAACCLTATIFFLIIGLLMGEESGYSGLILLPIVALSGLGFMLIMGGLLRERWRQKRGRHSSFFEKTVVDPWGTVSRTGLAVILLGVMAATLGLLTAGAGALSAVEYTESNEFCGQTCHDVMGPEETVYSESAHARIDCVECHVGPGGDSYLRAKLGGLRQLYALATGNVQRPIPTPIHDRRLSREMCASCHTPDRFIGNKALTRTYFPNAEESRPIRLGMMVKVGGGTNHLIKGGGIHYHMLIAEKVEYVARDPQRQDIVWVRVTDGDGETREYSNEDDPLSNEDLASLEVREMECVDCHSRPAHRFPSPVNSVNQAMAAGVISPKIPYIKEASVRALDGGYETTPQAMEEIEERIRSFYEEEYPEVIEDHSDSLTEVANVLKDVYSRTIFPEMKADWSAHPNNAGHRDSPGCFRCHNDEMVNSDGEAIFKDCTKCHAILAQDDAVIRTMADFEIGRDFVHPEDNETFDEFTLCTDCHTGGADLYD